MSRREVEYTYVGQGVLQQVAAGHVPGDVEQFAGLHEGVPPGVAQERLCISDLSRTVSSAG